MSVKTIKSNNIDGLQWLCCPSCGAKTKIGVYYETTLVFFPLYCYKCKTETLISGTQYSMLFSQDSHEAYMQTRKPVEKINQGPDFDEKD